MRALRVAHVVVTSAFAGVERYLTYVAPLLSGAGIDLTVIGGDGDAMRPRIEDAGGTWRPGGNVTAAFRSLVAARPHLVHAHMTAAEAVAVASFPLHRASLISTRHFAGQRGSSRLGRLSAPVVARCVRSQIAISDFVAGSVEGASTTIWNGVPLVPAGPHDERVVLVAQRLEAEKDTDVALRAWTKARLWERGWRLAVSGRGALDLSLRGLTAELGVAHSVEFVGFDEGIDARLARSALLLAPAPAEPFGLTVVEAMATALPVVAAAGGAHLETVGSVSTRWLFPPGDVDRCASLLTDLAADEETRQSYGEALRRRQIEQFSVDAHVERLVALYRSLMSGAPTDA